MNGPRTRPALSEIAEHLVRLGFGKLEQVVERRLFREPVEGLPALGRDEDPADILVDSDAWLRERSRPWKELGQVCAALADRFADAPAVRTRPEPLGELHYLCARIGALGASRGIARVLRREDLRRVLLPGGEDVQLRALRCLAGLLAQADPAEQQRFLGVFEQAMNVPQHLPMALTALVAFRPAERERYVRLAASHAPGRLEELVARLDRNVELLRTRE